MKTRKELLQSKWYWMERIQNSLFSNVEAFLQEKALTRTQFAEKLGVNKSRVSQILNGEFNSKLSSLVELSLAINKVPVIHFVDLEDFLKNEENKKTKSAYYFHEKGYQSSKCYSPNHKVTSPVGKPITEAAPYSGAAHSLFGIYEDDFMAMS